jgi:nitrate reductase gamma subunit
MNWLHIGVIIILLGIVLLLVDRRNHSRGRRSTVSASHGSVAVGGNSNAPIINASTVAKPEPSGRWLKVIGIIVELGGIAAVIWHATHLAGR